MDKAFRGSREFLRAREAQTHQLTSPCLGLRDLEIRCGDIAVEPAPWRPGFAVRDNDVTNDSPDFFLPRAREAKENRALGHVYRQALSRPGARLDVQR